MPLTTKSFFGTIRVSGDGIDGDPAEPGERVGIEASLSRCRRRVAEFTEDIEPRRVLSVVGPISRLGVTLGNGLGTRDIRQRYPV